MKILLSILSHPSLAYSLLVFVTIGLYATNCDLKYYQEEVYEEREQRRSVRRDNMMLNFENNLYANFVTAILDKDTTIQFVHPNKRHYALINGKIYEYHATNDNVYVDVYEGVFSFIGKGSITWTEGRIDHWREETCFFKRINHKKGEL